MIYHLKSLKSWQNGGFLQMLAVRADFHGTVMEAMSLHGPSPVFFLPTAQLRM